MSGSDSMQPEFALDEQAFRRKILYPLIPTNLKGAYASPALPDDFDPSEASAADLVKNGIMWRKPAATDDPAVMKAWRRAFSRKWLAKDWVLAQLEPQIGKERIRRAPIKPAGEETDIYLAGVNVDGGPIGSWIGNTGYWTVPTVTMPSEPPYQGAWNLRSYIGLDLLNDGLQAGTDQSVDQNGQASYVAWFQWNAIAEPGYPPYINQTNITNFLVSPGHEMYCGVQYVSDFNYGMVYLANRTTGQNFRITLAPPPGQAFVGNGFSWSIDPGSTIFDLGGEVSGSIPQFTPITFTSAVGCGKVFGNPQSGGIYNLETLDNKALTSVTVGDYTLTIDFIG